MYNCLSIITTLEPLSAFLIIMLVLLASEVKLFVSGFVRLCFSLILMAVLEGFFGRRRRDLAVTIFKKRMVLRVEGKSSVLGGTQVEGG